MKLLRIAVIQGIMVEEYRHNDDIIVFIDRGATGLTFEDAVKEVERMGA